jgi:hypothetical protein
VTRLQGGKTKREFSDDCLPLNPRDSRQARRKYDPETSASPGEQLPLRQFRLIVTPRDVSTRRRGLDASSWKNQCHVTWGHGGGVDTARGDTAPPMPRPTIDFSRRNIKPRTTFPLPPPGFPRRQRRQRDGSNGNDRRSEMRRPLAPSRTKTAAGIAEEAGSFIDI